MLGSYSLSLWLISSGVLSTIDPRRAPQVIGDITEGKKTMGISIVDPQLFLDGQPLSEAVQSSYLHVICIHQGPCSYQRYIS